LAFALRPIVAPIAAHAAIVPMWTRPWLGATLPTGYRRERSGALRFLREDRHMPIALHNGRYRSENASLAGSEFVDTDLEGSKFHDVNLRGADFSDVALTGARIRNACLGDVTIADANYAGMRIDGILVTELLRVYREHRGAQA
jgi:Pentapeptide repeats (8 copies)